MDSTTRRELERPSIAVSTGVTLDIGDGRGALIIYTSDSLCGEEIEISRGRPDAPRVHTVVRQRAASGQRQAAAVFPSLAGGTYFVHGGNAGVASTVKIADGEVSQLDWR